MSIKKEKKLLYLPFFFSCFIFCVSQELLMFISQAQASRTRQKTLRLSEIHFKKCKFNINKNNKKLL